MQENRAVQANLHTRAARCGNADETVRQINDELGAIWIARKITRQLSEKKASDLSALMMLFQPTGRVSP